MHDGDLGRGLRKLKGLPEPEPVIAAEVDTVNEKKEEQGEEGGEVAAEESIASMNVSRNESKLEMSTEMSPQPDQEEGATAVDPVDPEMTVEAPTADVPQTSAVEQEEGEEIEEGHAMDTA